MPSVNDNIVYQASTVLNGMMQTLTGQSYPVANNIGDFISVAQTAQKAGWDPVLNALSTMWNRTIMAVRPYQSKYPRLEMDAQRWGNATRKISFADSDVENDHRFAYPVGYDAGQTPPDGNGKSVDMYALHKPKVQQTVFYGKSVFEDTISIFRDQLDTAFRGPDEFVRFNAAIMTNRANKLEQYRENIRRGLVANAVCAAFELDTNYGARTTFDYFVVPLLTTYNTETGQNLSSTDVMQAANYGDFIRWVYGKIGYYARRMAIRSSLFQNVVDNLPIPRHTPADRLNIYVMADHMDQINARVRSTTFHDNYLDNANWEAIDYLVEVDNPCAIPDQFNFAIQTPTGALGSGTVGTTIMDTDVANIFGIMFDDDLMGSAVVNEWSAVTQFNTVGGYWNDTMHVDFRTRFDQTEKCIVFTLD